MRAQPSLHRHARSPRFGSILCSGWWDLDDDKQERRVAASSPDSHRAPSPHKRKPAPPHPRRRGCFFSRIAPLPPLPSAARSRLPLGPSHTHAAFARMSGVLAHTRGPVPGPSYKGLAASRGPVRCVASRRAAASQGLEPAQRFGPRADSRPRRRWAQAARGDCGPATLNVRTQEAIQVLAARRLRPA